MRSEVIRRTARGRGTGAVSLLVLLTCSGAGAKDFGKLDFDYVGDVETAYVSRGKIVEDRPIQIQLVGLAGSFWMLVGLRTAARRR